MWVGHIGALGLGIRINELAGFLEHGIRVYAGGLKNWGGNATFLAQDSGQQMGRADIRVAIRGGCLQGVLQGLLCFSGGVK